MGRDEAMQNGGCHCRFAATSVRVRTYRMAEGVLSLLVGQLPDSTCVRSNCLTGEYGDPPSYLGIKPCSDAGI
jgi:hypothetical protein